MRFSTRNAFYLRASNYRVVPLFLYLDERHVDWMSKDVLDKVIGELQPRIRELLTVERYEKKHRVHVERGDTYQYCYFLRKTSRTEVVLLKKKTFALRPPSPAPEPELDPVPSRKRKRSTRGASRARTATVEIDEGGEELREVEEDEVVVKEEPEDDAYVAPETRSESPDETAIKDWKPDVSLSYQGFGTSSVQLVLIVEPYPPLPPEEYAPPASRLSSRSASVVGSRASRSRTGVRGSRYSSTSLAPPPEGGEAAPAPQLRNMRNATRSVSVAGAGRPSATPGFRSGTRDSSATPGPGASSRRTPLFMPRDTPFGEDEEDEDEHDAYAAALREGRLRLPSIAPRDPDEDEDENPTDAPDGMVAMGERLVHASLIEEGVIRNVSGWEGQDLESDVLGRQEPGD